jgi:hypothetical protein
MVMAVGLSGCVEKVDETKTASDAPDQTVATAPGPTSSSPKDNNGRIVPDASASSGEVSASGGAPPAGDKDRLAKKAADLEAKLKGSPNDAKLKAQLAETLYQEGNAIMYDAALPPREKYGPALLLFNRALVYNPQHKGALENKATIEGIYQSMGMPIPK